MVGRKTSIKKTISFRLTTKTNSQKYLSAFKIVHSKSYLSVGKKVRKFIGKVTKFKPRNFPSKTKT